MFEIPKGWRELKDCCVHINESNTEIVITGMPQQDSDNHNCDQMGCGTLDHVILKCKITVQGL